jgi:hypothetical protein
MDGAALEHTCEHLPAGSIAILPASEYLGVTEWPWLLLIERCATQEDLEGNHYLETIGETIWRTTVGITHCPFCGRALQGDVESSSESSQAEFYHFDASGWYGTYR